MRRIATVLVLSLSMLGSACIVVPANNAAPPPPPPPPPVDNGYQPPPPPPPPAPTPYANNYPPPNDPGYQQPAPPPPPPPTTTTTTIVYYNDPPPQPVSYYEPAVVWYYGPHPVTPGYGYGWCPMQGPHTHNYDPYWNDRYEFYSGYYYYLGDPYAYDRTVVYYVYFDPHPNPWGGWCYAHGEHHHYYAPRQSDPFRYNGNRFVYAGSYDHVYYEHQNEYDQTGHRRGGNRYDDHNQYRQQHPASTTAGHESPNGHGAGWSDNRRDEHGTGNQQIQTHGNPPPPPPPSIDRFPHATPTPERIEHNPPPPVHFERPTPVPPPVHLGNMPGAATPVPHEAPRNEPPPRATPPPPTRVEPPRNEHGGVPPRMVAPTPTPAPAATAEPKNEHVAPGKPTPTPTPKLLLQGQHPK